MRRIMGGIICLLFCLGFLENISGASKKYYWHREYSAYKKCPITSECGRGERVGIVACYDQDLNQVVSDEMCGKDEKPEPFKEPCIIPCKTDTISFEANKWSSCEPVPDEDPDVGIQTREIFCDVTFANHTSEGPSWTDYRDCANHVGKKRNIIPGGNVTVRRCVVQKHEYQDCEVGNFSDWSSCCDGYQYASRAIIRYPRGGGIECPETHKFRKCDTQDGSCPKTDGYRWKIGTLKLSEMDPSVTWYSSTPKSCYSSKEIDFMDEFKYAPTVGTSTRMVSCIDEYGSSVNHRHCGKTQEPPRVRKSCIMQKPCLLSDWSDWKVIQKGCVDIAGKVVPRIMERYRYHKVFPEGDVKPCLPLKQTKSITNDLPTCSDLVQWQVSTWSDCLEPVTLKKVECGGGLQFRNLTCVDAKSGEPLPETECKVIDSPPVIQRCEMACPRDCIVGPWEPWEPCVPATWCPARSDGSEDLQFGFRKRYRSVIVPQSDLGAECPALIEIQPCQGTECFKWIAGTWGDCVLLPEYDSVKCGPGKRTRQVFCITNRKEIVEDYKCNPNKKLSTEEYCTVSCPMDCVLSPWGEWSSCEHVGNHTINSNKMRHRKKTIISPAGRGGFPCPSTHELVESEHCKNYDSPRYSWLNLPWTSCNVSCHSKISNVVGWQTREIWCIQNDNKRVDDSNCIPIVKPKADRQCSVKCPEQCRLSEWSSWSECPKTFCPSEEGFVGKNIRNEKDNDAEERRYRRRIRKALDGVACGHLEEKEPCPKVHEECPVYAYRVTNWTECALAEGAKCGQGFQTREAECYSVKDNRRVALRVCYNLVGSIPECARECHVECYLNCSYTGWSQWSDCDPGKKAKIRVREITGNSDPASCGLISLKQTEKCLSAADEYHSEVVGEWSSCIVVNDSFCGRGFRYRGYGCFNKMGRVDPSFCGNPEGIEKQECYIPCPIDCVTTEWTKWSSCSPKCGPGTQIRERKEERIAVYGGRPCGPMFQEKPCNSRPCSGLHWRTSSWELCELIDTEANCGTGYQRRNVECWNNDYLATYPDFYCDSATKPDDGRICSIPCPGECVLSEWSEWSACESTCNKDEKQQRTRSLLRSGNSTMQCPHSIETRNCEANKTCFTYDWTSTPYSSCLPLGGSECGEGIVTRITYCVRSDGWPVDDSFCKDKLKPSIQEKWCYIDCPVDCELGGWSDWNITECTCNDTGGMSRHAFVKTNPSPNGRQCPKERTQWKPCPVIPCHQWVILKPWSECKLEGASCGYGHQTAEAECIRTQDNVVVPDKHCAHLERPVEKGPCYVPCVTDCEFAEWGEWSECHSDCQNGNIGYQSRSREVVKYKYADQKRPCLKPMWETRDCEAICPTYQWKYNQKAELVCERSDGVIVESGCEGLDKPELKCIISDGICLCNETIEVDVKNGKCPDQEQFFVTKRKIDIIEATNVFQSKMFVFIVMFVLPPLAVIITRWNLRNVPDQKAPVQDLITE